MIRTRDCDIVQGDQNKPHVFLLHGFMTNRSVMKPLSKDLNELGYTTYACDARGHGDRDEFDEMDWEGTVHDWNDIAKHIDNDIVAIGISMGATESLVLGMTNPKVKQVFAFSPLYDQDYIIEHEHYLEKNLITDFDASHEKVITPKEVRDAKKYNNTDLETFIIYDANDEIVQREQFEKIIKEFNIPKEHQLEYTHDIFKRGFQRLFHSLPLYRRKSTKFVKKNILP